MYLCNWFSGANCNKHNLILYISSSTNILYKQTLKCSMCKVGWPWKENTVVDNSLEAGYATK